MLVYWALLSIALVWITRVVLDALLREAHRRGRDLERVLIVGDGEQAQLVEAKIQSAPELGYRVAGFIGNGASNPMVRPGASCAVCMPVSPVATHCTMMRVRT